MSNPRMIDDPSIYPTRDNCNRNDPEQRFLWMFVGMPGITGGAMPMPVPWLKRMSQHFTELGMMDVCPSCGHRETPTKWLDVPDDPHALLNPGVWREGTPPAGGSRDLAGMLAKMPAAEVAKIERAARETRERREREGGIQ